MGGVEELGVVASPPMWQGRPRPCCKAEAALLHPKDLSSQSLLSPSIIAINVSASPSTGGSWLRNKFITSFLSAATRSSRNASSAQRRYAINAATSSFGKSRLYAIDLSASFLASYRPAVAASSPHTIATAPDAVTFSRSTGSVFRSTALTRTSAGNAATGTSGGGAG